MSTFDSPAGYGTPSPGILIAGHFKQPDTYHVHRPQGIGSKLITFTLEGEGYFMAGGDKQLCGPGDLVVLREGVPHRYGTCPGSMWNFVWVHFAPLLFEMKGSPERNLFHCREENEFTRERIYRAFQRIIQDLVERGDYWQELCENSLREVLLLAARWQNRSIDPRIGQTLHLLSSRMKEQIRIEDLACAVGLSPSRLSHLFKEQVGRSIVDTLNRMRLEQAALLLEHTGRNASEVALDVGFQNYNHFANLFRSRYGTAPGKYKKGRPPRG